MPNRSILCALLALLITAAHASAGHVQADLLANVSAIQPGQPFWLGVRLTIDPNWHVYWKNPGDAGLPTRVKLTLPDGFTADDIQFPTPRKFEQPGNIVVFGYEGSVVLLAKITPPASLAPDFQGQFLAAVNWLVCSAICIPGKADLNLTLGVSALPSPANKDLFDDWSAQVPVKYDGESQVISSDVTASGKVFINVIWPQSAPDPVDLIPDINENFNILDTKVKSSHSSTEITFTVQPLAGKNPGPTNLDLVLGYQNPAGKRRGLIFSVALPSLTDNNNH
jgi:DsbC/DsbD-like thiol-disulfide interchange protein